MNLWQYFQASNISCTLVGNKILDHSDVVGYIFILDLTPGFNGLSKDNLLQDEMGNI